MSALRELINKANLTKTQNVISEFILDHSGKACFMTSTEIALKLGVSESSVIRFSRSLGFAGYSDFQKFLRRDYQKRVSSISNSITNPAQRIIERSKHGADTAYIPNHFKNTLRNLENVFAENTAAIIEKAADDIIACNRKYIVASRGNTGLGDFSLLYLKHMLPGVEGTMSPSAGSLDCLSNISKEDCVIAFSFPRYSLTDKLAVQMAYDIGAKIIVITDKPSASLASYATHLLRAPCDGDTFFNSLVGAQFVTEILLDAISRKVEGIEKRLELIDRYMEETGNF